MNIFYRSIIIITIAIIVITINAKEEYTLYCIRKQSNYRQPKIT